jgi:hypothetical protein
MLPVDWSRVIRLIIVSLPIVGLICRRIPVVIVVVRLLVWWMGITLYESIIYRNALASTQRRRHRRGDRSERLCASLHLLAAPTSTPTLPPDKAGDDYETCDSASDYISEVVMDYFAYSLAVGAGAVVVIVEAR